MRFLRGDCSGSTHLYLAGPARGLMLNAADVGRSLACAIGLPSPSSHITMPSNDMKCKCGGSTIELTSKKANDNNGKKFLKCNSCGKFVCWVDGKIRKSKSERKPNSDRQTNDLTHSQTSFPDTNNVLFLYTDGACKGNNNVHSKVCPAGWGVAVYVQGEEGEILTTKLIHFIRSKPKRNSTVI